jgi:diguanylate cyclase (GGDEF)-like protein
VVLVAGWYEGRIPGADAALLLLVSVAGAVVSGGAGVLAVLAGPGPAIAVPLAVGCALGLGVQRGWSALHERQQRLRHLHDLSDALLATPESGDVVGLVLGCSLEVVAAGYAEANLVAGDGDTAQSWVLRAGGAVRGPVVSLEPDVEAMLPPDADHAVLTGRTSVEKALLSARGVAEAIVVPLRGPHGRVGTLFVGDRAASLGGTVALAASGSADARLLETVANHASVALRHSGLVRRLHDEARLDDLTGLPNRLRLRELLDVAARACAAGGPPCVTMVLDFDGFKAVNDTLGHPAGDELLRVLAGRLAVAAGDDAMVARLGGDEFAILSTCCSTPEQAGELADRLLDVFSEPAHVAGARLRLGGSLGVAIGPQHGVTSSDLMRNADIAMYAAKAAGGGRRTFEQELVELTADGLTLATDLRDAIDRDEIAVVVQPVIELATDRLHSVEVLARWQHPELGEVPPAQFFAAAERSGQLGALSACILDRALALARRWAEGGRRVRVAVNLASRSLAEPSLPEQVGAALARHGVAADLLSLEITERGMIADPSNTTVVLDRLRAMGVHLSVDDFGTGYSSLTYLSRLPVDQMKIDQSFVSQLDGSARDRAIVRSMIDLGRNLGLEVVAEGVMTASVRRALAELGCQLGQGYLFARPLDPAALPDYLAGLEAEVGAPATVSSTAARSRRPDRPDLPRVGAQRHPSEHSSVQV